MGTYAIRDSQGPFPDLFHFLPDSKSFHQHHHVYLSVKYLPKSQMEQVLGGCRETKETYLRKLTEQTSILSLRNSASFLREFLATFLIHATCMFGLL